MKIAIIGGGAAGLMAAATIAESGVKAEVFIIEKNVELGKKVMLSGGGRCNVTTGLRDIKDVLAKYPRGNRFLSKPMYAFSPLAAYDWFEDHGVPLKIQPDMRVFPVSDRGRDVVGIFEKIFSSAKVDILLNAQVIGIAKAGKSFKILVKDRGEPLRVDKVILTTGGQAYRQTGSTGDGYAFAASLGHSITPLAPSLSAFHTKETWPATLSGLSFQDAEVSASVRSISSQVHKVADLRPDGPERPDRHFSASGPFLFTHKGISGPAVFALSSLVAFEQIDALRPLPITVDLFPGTSVERLRTLVEEAVADNAKRSFVNMLTTLVPKSLSEIVSVELGLFKNKKAGEVSKKDLGRCVAWLKSIPLHAVARAAGEEFVTAGGVDLSEVDPATMQSKLCPGLYLAGEILDIDGFTGGFNLQSAWATGRSAGKSAVSGC